MPWQLKAAGAPPLTVGIYDREQNVHCTFMLDEAGQMRCLPVQRAAYHRSPDNAYVDAACTQRAFMAEEGDASADGDPPVSVTLLSDGYGCEPERHIVGRISVLPAHVLIWWLDANGQCVTGGTTVLDASPIGVLVDRIAPEAFVAATESAGPLLQSRLRVSQLKTGDGALFSDHFVDERYGKPCAAERRGDEVVQCWPAVSQYNDVNFDSTCEDSPVFATACGLEAFGQHGLQYFAFGDPYQGPLFGGTIGCGDYGSTPPRGSTLAYFKQGPLLAENDLVVRMNWQLAGTGRLQLRGVAQDDGSFLAIPNALRDPQDMAFEDRETNQACTPVWTPEGKVRCAAADVPSAWDTGLFGDATCTKKAYECGGDCADKPVLFGTDVVYGELRVSELRTAVAVTAVYDKSPNESCQLTDLSSAVTAGDVVPWTRLPALKELYPRAHSN